MKILKFDLKISTFLFSKKKWILKFDLKFSYISHDSLKGEIKRNLPHIEHEEPPT
jgi:hypothetical protein